jgi:tetratricopeptide (TPR) repeat protein
MVTDRSIAVLSVMIWLAPSVWAQTTGPAAPSTSYRALGAPDALTSASAARRFAEIAEDLAHADSVTGPQADQAIVLLTAAQSLDSQGPPAEPLLLELATQQTERDYSQHILIWLQSYVSADADRAIVARAIRYVLDRQTSADGRLKQLEDLVQRVGNRNAAVDSDLATSLGLLMLEKGDTKAARFYFLQAYKRNKYNPTAFAKLAELAPGEFGPAAYLEHLRLVLRENPLDTTAALNVAQYAERLQLYDVAAGTYQYTVDLFRYLYPKRPVPPDIYLPWAIACYNTKQQKRVCVQIAESVRSRRRFDFLLEVVAGRATAKLGNPQEGRRLLAQAEQMAQQFVSAAPGQPLATPQGPVTAVRHVGPQQMAWFYCLAAPDAIKALDWANKSYSTDPNSPATAALLAYALSMNGELERTKPFLKSFTHNQIADLVQAQMQLADGDKAGAVETLTAAIAKDPGSLAAERARGLLAEQGTLYQPPVDTNGLMTYLTETIGAPAVPQFVSPDKRIALQLTLRGRESSYGADIEGTVAIVNKGPEPLVVTENGLFAGRIRISAHVSGDLTREIPGLVSRTIRTALVVPAGRSVAAPVRLSTGRLRKLLLDHPQASLDIRFTLYADPVATAEGALANKLAGVAPAVVTVRRPGMELSAQYVRNRSESIASGQEAQKLRTALLFTGLLKEQNVMARRGPLYAYQNAEWLPGLLRSSLVGEPGLLLNSGDGDWVVRVNAMAGLLTMPIDRELATVVAKNLNHDQWPVRLMAVYLLASIPDNDFRPVLDWVAQNDASEFVRSMAIALRPVEPPAQSLQSVNLSGTPRSWSQGR